METDAPDALPKSDLESLYLVDEDPSLWQELRVQEGNSASNSGSVSNDCSNALKDSSTLPKETLNHPANIHNVSMSLRHLITNPMILIMLSHLYVFMVSKFFELSVIQDPTWFCKHKW